MNIFDLRGPEFLVFYVGLLGCAIGLAIFWRRARGGPSDPPDLRTLQLDPFELAYLAGGETGLARAIVASLVYRGIVELKPGGGLKVIGELKPTPHWCERTACEVIKKAWFPSLSNLPGRIDVRPMRDKLDAGGLTLSDDCRFVTGSVQALGGLVVLAVGVIKVWVGISRDRPVGFLVCLCFVCLMLLIVGGKPPLRSRRGDAALEALRKANSTLHTTALADTKALSATDVVTAFALWGSAALSGDVFATMRAALARTSGVGGAAGGSSSCGGGSGCGGGSCGGGCGGCGS